MNKVEGKVADFCPKCKNCKSTSWGVYDEKYKGLTEVECEDPYDGLTREMFADDEICCSMFDPRLNEPCDKISLLQHELEMDKLRKKIHELEKEKAAHMKGIERLKKRAADSDYYKEKSELLEEKYIARGKDIDHLLSENKEKDKKISELEEKLKKANELADSWKRDYEFVRDRLIHPIYDILYPGNCPSYEKKKEKESFDLNMPREALEAKILDLFEEKNRLNGIINGLEKEKAAHMKGIERLKKSQEKLQNIVIEKDVEIKGLRKDNVYLNQNKLFGDEAMKKNTKLNQTISDQEITIKALLITIKEMCKEDETNE